MMIQGLLIQMSLSMKQSLFMALELTTSDSACRTIFPEVEEWLEDTDRQNAIEAMARNKNVSKYRSVIDFLCCEINPELRKQCFKFYLSDKEEDMLAGSIDGLMRNRYAGRMLLALEVAYQAFQDGRKMSWTGLLSSVDDVERVAA